MAEMDIDGFGMGRADRGSGAAAPLLNWASAAISVGLIAGLAIWGYRLMVLDVTGVPVIRALEGPMRIQPDDPGGRQALHQGLSVNRVQAAGSAEPAAERLILAPEPVALIDSDAPVPSSAPLPQADPQPPAEDAAQPAPRLPPTQVAVENPDTMEALARQVALDVATSGSHGGAADTATDPGIAAISASDPGVSVSLRPMPRPAPGVIAAALARAQTVREQTPGTPEVDAASVAVGTRLVQLGAFDSPEVARAEWDRLAERFSEYFADKSRVVQRTQSGGRVFHRLRAMGFADLSDARRFCSVLLAEEAACIPVVMR